MNLSEVVTKGDLKELLSAINARFDDLQKSRSSSHDRWLRSNQVKEILNISSGKLQQLRISGKLPYSKVGGTLFYKYSNIQTMLENNKIK